MTWLAFIAELVKATAWPAAALAIVLIVRKPVIGLIPMLTRFKWRDFEFEFGKQIAEAQAEATATLPPTLAGRALPSATTQLAGLIDVSPRAAVLEAWIQVDRAARGAVVRHELPQPVQPYVSTSKIISVLQSSGFLDADRAGLVHDLRGLRNQAAHAPDFALTRDAARNYVELAARLIDYLDSV